MLHVQASSGSGEEAEDEGDSDEGNDDEVEEEGPPAKKAKVRCLPYSHQERMNKIMTMHCLHSHRSMSTVLVAKLCFDMFVTATNELSQVPTLHDCYQHATPAENKPIASTPTHKPMHLCVKAHRSR